MATKEKDRDPEDVEETEAGAASSEDIDSDESAGDDEGSDDEDSDDEDSDDDSSGDEEASAEDETAAGQLGATRYVHAALFSAGILLAYISGKMLGALWNSLAEWPSAVAAVPQLLAYSEDDRPNFTMALGAVIGAITIIQVYRKPHIRTWADEVAQELAKVTWPNKEVVTNGTVVVVIASIIATAYIAVLDKFWGFLTSLVYGA